MKRILRLSQKHVYENAGYYLMLLAAFFLGVLLGAFSFYGGEEVRTYLQEFFGMLTTEESYSSDLFYPWMGQTLFFVVALAFCSLSVFGFVLVPVLVAYKGFLIGFTAAVFYTFYQMRAIAFVLVGILPSALFWLPALLFFAFHSIHLSRYVLDSCRHRMRTGQTLLGALLQYAVASLISLAFFAMGGAVEIALVPRFLKLISSLYI